MEAPGQYVQQESPDELMRMQPHRLPARRAVGAVVLPAERDAGVVGCNEAAVGDGDTVGVTGKIAQHLLMCRFLDAGMTRGASHSGGRRPKSAKARSCGKF